MIRSAFSAVLLLLPGCSQDTPEAPLPDDSAIVDEPEAVATPVRPNEAAAAPDAGGYSSAYTELDFADCETLTENREEGSSATYRCPGYKGIDLFVQEGDLRFDLDAGVDNGRFVTAGPFNDIAETLEWRMRDGTPFAVIFRYRLHHELGEQPTELAVEKIGTTQAPGCRVAHIAGSIPDANRRARAIADAEAAGFACGERQPINIGGTVNPLIG